MAVAILALLLAMSTSATAALVITGSQIKNGSVTGKDIKNRSVTGKDIKKKAIGARHLKKKAVRSKHVKDGSITSSHLRDGTVQLSDVSAGLIDVLGNGVGGFQVVTATVESGFGSGTTTASASCPAGKVAISANSYWDGTNTFAPQMRRVSNGSFSATAPNPATVPESLVLQVTCVNA